MAIDPRLVAEGPRPNHPEEISLPVSINSPIETSPHSSPSVSPKVPLATQEMPSIPEVPTSPIINEAARVETEYSQVSRADRLETLLNDPGKLEELFASEQPLPPAA